VKKMRPVDMLKWEKIEGSYKHEPVPTGESGKFIQYGVDYEEFETGPGPFTTAIVEMPDGTVMNIDVRLIRFTDLQRREENTNG